MNRPNILILMSDEHRYDVAGFAGNKVVRTPVLDGLAKEGVVFDNCYTPSPICVPARQCLAAGQLTKTCNVSGSWMDLAPNYPTFAKRFSQYAYHTVCSGKLHHMGNDQMQGWSIRLAPDAEVYDKYKNGMIKSEFLAYSKNKTRAKMTDEMIVKGAKPIEGKFQIYDNFAFESMKSYIEGNCGKADGRPFLLKFSLVQPHFPYQTSKEKFDYYYDKVSIYEEKSCDHPVLSLSQDNRKVNVNAEEIRRATATYYGMTETIDTYYGQVLEALKNCGQNIDEWVIVYLSDHGEMLGQHGLWEKSRYFEASVRVPMVIRYPKMFKGGSCVNQNVNLCDLYATLCDLAGLPAQPGLDSRSLVSLMKGDASNWLNESVSQIRRGNEDHVMIKYENLKYQYYGEAVTEVLFDLNEDPDEKTNAINDSKYQKEIKYFRERLANLGYGPNADKDYVNAGYRSGVEESLIEGDALWPEDSNPWLDPLE